MAVIVVPSERTSINILEIYARTSDSVTRFREILSLWNFFISIT